MDLETTEWGFVPPHDVAAEALDGLWAPRVEWDMDEPEHAGEGDDGVDHVSVWKA